MYDGFIDPHRPIIKIVGLVVDIIKIKIYLE